jgi:hypothetical protein
LEFTGFAIDPAVNLQFVMDLFLLQFIHSISRVTLLSMLSIRERYRYSYTYVARTKEELLRADRTRPCLTLLGI